MELTIQTLVRSAQRGDRSAFAALIRKHERFALSLAFGVLNNADAAGDAVQESFLTAWKQIRNLQEPEKFSGWLAQIVRNAAIDLQRRQMRESRKVPAPRPSAPTASDRAVNEELRQTMAAALARLDETSRSIVVLRYYQGLSSKEIAATLGIAPAAVDMRLSRARTELRGHLGAKGDHV